MTLESELFQARRKASELADVYYDNDPAEFHRIARDTLVEINRIKLLLSKQQ